MTTENQETVESLKTTIAEVKKILLIMKTDARFCIADRIRNTQEYKDLMAIPYNKLPMYINEYPEDSAKQFFIKCHLNGDDPFETNLSKCIEILWDQEFDMSTYKDIGFTDGIVSAISRVFDVLGMDKDSNEALDATYSYD